MKEHQSTQSELPKAPAIFGKSQTLLEAKPCTHLPLFLTFLSVESSKKRFCRSSARPWSETIAHHGFVLKLQGYTMPCASGSYASATVTCLLFGHGHGCNIYMHATSTSTQHPHLVSPVVAES